MNKQGAVLLLAGGRSQRMGTDKALLPIAGTTLLNWQRQRLAELDLPLWHSGPGGIIDVWSDFRGPLAGLYSAMVQQPDPAFWLVVPVDMPALPLERLRRLMHSIRDIPTPVAYANSPLPLAVPVKTALRSTLKSWLNRSDGPRSVHALISHSNGRWLTDTLAEHDRLNLNTPEDWSSFQANSNLLTTVPTVNTGDTSE